MKFYIMKFKAALSKFNTEMNKWTRILETLDKYISTAGIVCRTRRQEAFLSSNLPFTASAPSTSEVE